METPCWPSSSWTITNSCLLHNERQLTHFDYFRDFWGLNLVFQIYWSCSVVVQGWSGEWGQQILLVCSFLYVFSLSREEPILLCDAEGRWNLISPRAQRAYPKEQSSQEQRGSRHKAGKRVPTLVPSAPGDAGSTPVDLVLDLDLEPRTRTSRRGLKEKWGWGMGTANQCLALQLLKKKGLMTSYDHFVPSITFLWKNK